ncbi:uncharacterized protein LOC126898399 isoform X2 [Daktulosphaira vitifoliae]|uniref:uncharacterized protein LOC126898399 isoform X2 n=1 Tax=Daktulosphaira vitifoliae TaxID=58002 RepID=UPI0021AAA6F5|nr:uncharacterized protein LOC126898399 isoform X2 [Daktulosphaira vitifoliae]
MQLFCDRLITNGDGGDDRQSRRTRSKRPRPFKVWDGARATRKSLVLAPGSATVTDLVVRGKRKLNVADATPVRLVLETDGTHVEDDEYLEGLPDHSVVLLLKDDEFWLPGPVPPPITAIPKIVCDTVGALLRRWCHDHLTAPGAWTIAADDRKGRVTVVLHWDKPTAVDRGCDSIGRTNGDDQDEERSIVADQRECNQRFRSDSRSSEKQSSFQEDQHQRQQMIEQKRRMSASLMQQSPQSSFKQGDHQHQSRKTGHHQSTSTDWYHTNVSTSTSGLSPPLPRSAGISPPRLGLSPSKHVTMTSVHLDTPEEPCDFHCCALHEEGRPIAVTATSPVQEPTYQYQHSPQHHDRQHSHTNMMHRNDHHSLHPNPQQPMRHPHQQQQQPQQQQLTRRLSPKKGHVRFSDMPEGPLPPPILPSTQDNDGENPTGQDSSSEETTTDDITVLEDGTSARTTNMAEKYLLLVDRPCTTSHGDITVPPRLTVKDVGLILERLRSKIPDVRSVEREVEPGDQDECNDDRDTCCYNWTIRATVRGRGGFRELGVIYDGGYYAVSEHPGYSNNSGNNNHGDENSEDCSIGENDGPEESRYRQIPELEYQDDEEVKI